jgi:hypothetical protein
MLAEALALTTYSAAPEVEFSQAFDPEAAPYEFEQADTDVSADGDAPGDPAAPGGAVSVDVSPEAVHQLSRILEAAAINAPGAKSELDTADDGGLLLEVGDESTGREVLFAISPENARVYFSTSETPSLNGIVTLESGLNSLLQWVAGTGQISKESLLLPSK